MGIALTGAERQARWRARHPEKAKAHNDDVNTRAVWVGNIYVGLTLRPETAKTLNEAIRKEQHARKQQSRA